MYSTLIKIVSSIKVDIYFLIKSFDIFLLVKELSPTVSNLKLTFRVSFTYINDKEKFICIY